MQHNGLFVGAGTDTGRVRKANEDAFALAPDLGFFVVTDGVSTSPAGAVAARMAAAAMVAALRQARAGLFPAGPDLAAPFGDAATEGARLTAAAHNAHTMVVNHAIKNRSWGAAATMAALWILGEEALIANAGDSRVYKLDAAGSLKLLSKDHTLLQEHIDDFGPPSISLERRLGHIVTQVIGGKTMRPPTVRVATEALFVPPEPGTERPRVEHFLLCTDGLTKMVQETDIAFVLKHTTSPQVAADALIALANEAGGGDNITVVVVRVERPEEKPPSSLSSPSSPRSRPH